MSLRVQVESLSPSYGRWQLDCSYEPASNPNYLIAGFAKYLKAEYKHIVDTINGLTICKTDLICFEPTRNRYSGNSCSPESCLSHVSGRG
jgi:hypothetical protein